MPSSFAIVIGIALIVHIWADWSRYREMRRQAHKFEAVRAEVRKFLEEAREMLK